MELREVLAKRSSVRKFTNDGISVEDLREMVRFAGMAPSTNNSQPWKFIAITNRDLLKRMGGHVCKKLGDVLSNVANETDRRTRSQVEWFSTFFEDAPVVIAVARCPYKAIVDEALPDNNLCHEDMNAWRGHPDILSIGASVENLVLMATEMGYGSCWMSGPLVAREELEKELGIEDPWKLGTMVALGVPTAPIKQRDKKPLEEIFELRA